MAHHDGVITIRTGRDNMNRHTRDLFNPLQVQACIGRKLVILRHANRAVCPARNGFVDWLASFDVIGAHGQDVNQLTVEFIAGTQLQFFQTIEYV